MLSFTFNLVKHIFSPHLTLYNCISSAAGLNKYVKAICVVVATLDSLMENEVRESVDM